MDAARNEVQESLEAALAKAAEEKAKRIEAEEELAAVTLERLAAEELRKEALAALGTEDEAEGEDGTGNEGGSEAEDAEKKKQEEEERQAAEAAAQALLEKPEPILGAAGYRCEEVAGQDGVAKRPQCNTGLCCGGSRRIAVAAKGDTPAELTGP